MGGPWDKPNMYSEPGKARWLIKGNTEEIPHISDSNYHKGETLSLSPPMCVYSHVLFFLLINTLLVSLLSVSLWKFISTKLMGQGLVTAHWSLVARIQRSHCRGLTSTSGLGTEIYFKLPKAEATWDQGFLDGISVLTRKDQTAWHSHAPTLSLSLCLCLCLYLFPCHVRNE